MAPRRDERDDASSLESAAEPVVGIFVGGQGKRMGGAVKGLLRTPSGPTILEHLTATVRRASGGAEIVLVGEHASLRHTPWPRLEDAPPGQGPLGGLSALLRHAARVRRPAVALASDLPDLTPALLRRLIHEAEAAAIHAPRLDGIFQPLFARYAPGSVLPAVDAILASERKSLLAVLERVGVTELVVDDDESKSLRDWDQPRDLPPALRAQLERKPR